MALTGCRRRRRIDALASSSNEYTTGVTSSVSSKTKGLPPDDHDRHRATFLGARAGPEREGEHPGDQGERGHEDGWQSVAVGLENGRQPVLPAASKLVHVINLEDGVLLHHAKQNQQPEGRTGKLSVLPLIQSANKANGSDNGRESRMVKG